MSDINDRPAEKEKIHLTGVQETLLLTLWARDHDAASPAPLLGDTWSRHILNQIEGGDVPRPDSLLTPFVALRSRSLDAWTRAFLARHADQEATVLSLACGLDSRCLRLKPGRNTRWVDVELPDVAQLRRKLLPAPEGDDYELVAASAMDDAWLKDVPPDRPTFIIFEGLSMYLAQEEGEAMLERLANHFTPGEIEFDAVRPIMITCQAMFRDVKRTGSTLKWAVGDPKEIERRHQRSRLKDVRYHSRLDGLGQTRMSARIVLTLLDYIPGVWGTGQHLLYEF